MSNNRRLRERDSRGMKAGPTRASRGSGRNSIPQNASPPTTSLKSLHGLYANQHFVHVASVARGCTAELQVKSGKKFEGILTTFSPSGEVELRLAHPVDSSDTAAIPSKDQVTEKMLFKAPSIVCINLKDVDMDYAHKGADAFQTDAEIAARRQNGQVTDRELEVWDTDNANPVDLADDSLSAGNSNGWSAEDMFKKNEQMGVTSSYDSNLGDYTTPLEMKDTEEHHRRVQRAERMAQKIEGSSDYRHRINKELECSEEERFSAVVRPTLPSHSSSPSPTSSSSNADGLNAGRYVPPAMRNRQGGEGLSNSGVHHRNSQRGTPPQGMGRTRAQSPHTHIHPSHPQQPHMGGGQGSPHGMTSPQQRVQTPPHSHPASRSPQMPMQMQSPQQAPHIGGTPRSATGIPQHQPPLPQRIPASGRRTTAEVVQGGGPLRSPVQSAVPAAAAVAATADKQPNVDKSRDGAGPLDVDKKTSEVPQPQRVAPPLDKSQRANMSDPVKKQTIEGLHAFKDNFMLQDTDKGNESAAGTLANPQQAAPATPGATQPQTTQVAATSQSPAQPAVPAAASASAESPGNPSPSAAPAVTAAATSSTTSAATTPTSVAKLAEKPTTPTSSTESKKEDLSKAAAAKSTLNPNAKEFNPMAKSFVPAPVRIHPQKTPTPPRPPSQPSPATQQVIQSQYGQPISQPIYQLHQPHYQMRALGQRKGATNLPQIRSHAGDIQHILPVSMAAGQPLVAPVPAAVIPFQTPHQGPGGQVSTAQTVNVPHVLSQQQHIQYNALYPKQMNHRIQNQQSMVAGQHGGPGQHQHQHQMSQDAQQVMVFPQMITGLNTFQPSGNIPMSQQAPNQMPTPYHQFSQQQQQPQHHQNPAVHLQQHQPQPHQPHQPHQHQHQPHQHQHPHQQSHPSHPQSHQHTTPPQAHTPQGQTQGNVMQQPQPAHGGRPSPSPVSQVMHQQHQQQQQQQTYHQGMQAMGQPQPQNPQMMAAMAAMNQQGGAGGSPHGGNHNQQQNMIPQLHHHVINYQQAPHQVANITNVTPVHANPHPHPKTVFLQSAQGQHGGAGGQQGLQAIPMHGHQPSLMSSPVQGPYLQTPQGQLQAQVPQYQTNN